MNPSEGGSSGLVLPNLFVLLLVGWGIFSGPGRLDSPRPDSTSIKVQAITISQSVEARLWQDPLAAISKVEGRVPTPKELQQRGDAALESGTRIETLGDRFNDMRDRTIASDGKKVVVLGVMMSGSPYPEDAEKRLRTRYAVISSLARSGYRPSANARIGFLYSVAMAGSEKKVVRIPYEEYLPLRSEGSRGDFSIVLVLYIDEALLGITPYGSIASIVRQAGKPSEWTAEKSNRLWFRFLGPDGSDGLAELLKDAVSVWSLDHAVQTMTEHQIEFYAPIPTVSSTALKFMVLGEERDDDHLAGKDRGEWVIDMEKLGIKIYRTSNTDQELCVELVEELKKRRIDLWKDFEEHFDALQRTAMKAEERAKKNPDQKQEIAWPAYKGGRIAIVSEFDTFYGRTLPSEFRSAVSPLTLALADQATDFTEEAMLDIALAEQWDANVGDIVIWYSYLRGLDGRLPEEARPEIELAPAAGAKGAGKARSEQFPEGRSQIDYVRRLVERMQARHRHGLENGDKGIQAIGVLGSDIYDKVVLLRALRRAFPGVEFFTTDFDALYLHPIEYPHARNLIVASRFGLELREEFQGPIPPFRDSYQTAQYYSCLRALGFFEDTNMHRGWAAQIFEIGRDRAYNLGSSDTMYVNAESREETHTPKGRLGPLPDGHVAAIVPGERMPVLQFVLTGFAMAILFALMMVLASKTIRDQVERGYKARSPGLLAFLALVAGFFCMIIIIGILQAMPGQEPFSMFGGVSAWPSTILRAFVAVLAGFYIWLGFSYLNFNRTVLQQHVEDALAPFDLPMPPPRRGALPKAKKQKYDSKEPEPPPRGLLRCFNYGSILGAKDFHGAWKAYVDLSAKGGCRMARIGICALVLLGLILFAVLVLGLQLPNYPVRGIASYHFQNAVIFLSMMLMIVLIIFMIDANVLCSCIIGWIARYFGRTTLAALKKTHDASGETGPTLEDRFDAHHELIRLVAARVGAVSKLLYYPFACLLLMILARHSVFDNFNFPPLLAGVFAVAFLLLIMSSATLHRNAKKSWARARALLEERRANLRRRAAEGSPGEFIDMEISALARLESAPAFAVLRHNPIVRAAAIPLGGVGAIQVMELVSKV